MVYHTEVCFFFFFFFCFNLSFPLSDVFYRPKKKKVTSATEAILFGNCSLLERHSGSGSSWTCGKTVIARGANIIGSVGGDDKPRAKKGDKDP